MTAWNVNVLTLFPELFPGPLGVSVVGRALKAKRWNLNVRSIFDYAYDKHKTVDDTPFGGGAGMVARPDVLGEAIELFFVPNGYPILHLSPGGKKFDQHMAKELSLLCGMNILCSRFEGIDERVISEYNILELSIGDYVISAGDIAAFVIIDACVRLLHEVIDCNGALDEESFGIGKYEHLLEYPHYTKPRIWKGIAVPDVLLSGNHAKIAKWRLEQAEQKTAHRREDLWKKHIHMRKCYNDVCKDVDSEKE